MRNGIEPWPGVPRTRSRRQATPFSADGDADRRVVLGRRRGGRRSRSAGSRSGSRPDGGRRPSGRRGRCRPPRRRRRSRSGRRAAGTRASARSRNATAIDDGEVEHVDRAAPPDLDAVRRSARRRTGRASIPRASTGTTSVWPIRHRLGAVGIAPVDAGDERRPPRRRLPALDRRRRALDERLEHVGVAGLVARLRRAVVDALVADQRLQQLDGGVHCWCKIRPMGRIPSGFNVGGVVRAADEEHRASTPLELFFDLCFVVAIAQAASQPAPRAGRRRRRRRRDRLPLVFFAIWWAWVNFTWFASAYDTDDVVYRLSVFVQMAGVLILAAGVPRAMFADQDFGDRGRRLRRDALRAGGAMAARRRDSVPEARTAALRFASGITCIQLRMDRAAGASRRRFVPAFVVLALARARSLPMWAESRGTHSWHPGHIAERYGLFTIIVLGESVLAATVGVQEALDGDGALTDRERRGRDLGLVIVFACGGRTSPQRRPGLRPVPRRVHIGVRTCRSSAARRRSVPASTSRIGGAVGHGEHVPTQRLAALAVTVPLAVGATGFATVVATQWQPPRAADGSDPARHGRPAPRGWTHLVGQAGDRRDGDRRHGRHDRAGPARPPHVRGGAGMTHEASIEADVRRRVAELSTVGVEVVECDPSLADTAQFCAAYGYAMEDSANAIVVIGKSDPPVYAMCVVLDDTPRREQGRSQAPRHEEGLLRQWRGHRGPDRHDDRRRDPVRRARRPADLGRRRRHGSGSDRRRRREPELQGRRPARHAPRARRCRGRRRPGHGLDWADTL